jgi:hypothetical protein
VSDRPITALLLLEFTDPEGIDPRDLAPGDEIDEGVADMVAQDAAEVVENHYRVKATVVRGFYPASVFGDADNPDSDASDPGVRLVRALRACARARREGTAAS